jgi:hypothetical protein
VKRPAPIRTDGSIEFARYSMEKRVPAIARDVIAHNPGFSPAVRRGVERLARDIEGNAPIPPPKPPAPDVASWTDAYLSHASDTWLDAEWFYAEYAFYRELAHACRFWETGRDPFAWTKEEEIASDALWARLGGALGPIHALARTERLALLMEQTLWGNRMDLSYRVAADRTQGHEGDLLADDRAAALTLLSGAGARVHLVADNTGTELAFDLALIDALLEDEETRVTLHLKAQPVFVSDAIVADVWALLDRMRGRPDGSVARVAERLFAAFDDERLSFAPDPFWSGARFFDDARAMPAYLREELAAATILVLKGDANYRRLSGDALWPEDATFAQACSNVPCPVACLRTMKSDSVVGLPAALVAQLDATDSRWRIDGKRGVIQVGATTRPVLSATAQS